MEDTIELTRRKERLIATAAAQRAGLAAAFRQLHGPIAAIDRAAGAARFLRSHPVLVAAIVAVLVVYRRRGVIGIASRAIAAWRMWRVIDRWALGLGRSLRGRGR
jgi:hypothetical protein